MPAGGVSSAPIAPMLPALATAIDRLTGHAPAIGASISEAPVIRATEASGAFRGHKTELQQSPFRNPVAFGFLITCCGEEMPFATLAFRSGGAMQPHVSIVIVAAAFATTVAVLSGPAGQAQSQPNASGDVRTLALNGSIDRRNPFFRPLGKQFPTTCEHCHFASDAWGILLNMCGNCSTQRRASIRSSRHRPPTTCMRRSRSRLTRRSPIGRQLTASCSTRASRCVPKF